MTHIDRFNAFVDHGWLARCSGLQLKVWSFLTRRANGKTGENAFPSLATIADAVGNTRRRVSEALRDLLALGLIEQTSAATFTTSAVYRVCDPPAHFEGEASKTDTPAQNDIDSVNSGSARNGQETPVQNGQETPAQNGRPIRSSIRTIIRETAAQSSAEPDGAGSTEDASDPALITFQTVGRETSWGLTQSLAKELQDAYPGVDVIGEAKKARVWCINNPTKRKTSRGMAKFLQGWIERTQNRSPSPGRPTRSLAKAGTEGKPDL